MSRLSVENMEDDSVNTGTAKNIKKETKGKKEDLGIDEVETCQIPQNIVVV